MAPETQTATAAPALETPERDWSGLETELGEEATVETPAPASTEKPVVPEVPAPTETPAPVPTDDDLKNLDALIEQGKAAVQPTPEVPATPEVESIQLWAKDPVIAKRAVTAVEQFFALDKAASSGDFEGVLKQFAPQFTTGLFDYIYKTQKEQFAQRLVDELEGTPKADPRLSKLEQELTEMRGMLTERQKREMADQEGQQRVQSKQRYDAYWDAVFKSVNVTDQKHQRMLRGAVMDELSRNPAAAANVRAGRYGDIGQVFKPIYVDWIAERKAADTAKGAARDQQEQRKTGQLATATASTTPNETAEADFDEDGKRSQSFMKRELSKIKGWFD